LAPENHFFYPKFPDFTFHSPPEQIENMKYQIARQGDRIELTHHFELMSVATSNVGSLKITKSLSPAFNPLRNQIDPALFDVCFAGYGLCTTLEILNKNEFSESIGLWDLIQMPHGGEMSVATYCRATPRFYFGSIPVDDLTVKNHSIQCKMRAPGMFKIGISPLRVTGRSSYLYQAGDCWNLVIFKFPINPSGLYVDVPCDDIESPGDCVQGCSVNNELGAFSEMEYHTPAIGKVASCWFCRNESQVWAFRGALDTIQKVANTLLVTSTCE
jgi:hypothetical protein